MRGRNFKKNFVVTQEGNNPTIPHPEVEQWGSPPPLFQKYESGAQQLSYVYINYHQSRELQQDVSNPQQDA